MIAPEPTQLFFSITRCLSIYCHWIRGMHAHRTPWWISYIVSITAGWQITKEFRDKVGTASFLPFFCSVSFPVSSVGEHISAEFYFPEIGSNSIVGSNFIENYERIKSIILLSLIGISCWAAAAIRTANLSHYSHPMLCVWNHLISIYFMMPKLWCCICHGNLSNELRIIIGEWGSTRF